MLMKGRFFVLNPTLLLKGDVNTTGLISVIRAALGDK
jgi:hypothetical protein